MSVEERMNAAFSCAIEALNVGEVPVGCVFVYDEGSLHSLPCQLHITDADASTSTWTRGQTFSGRNRTNELKNATKHAELVAIDAIRDYCVEKGLSICLL